MVPAAVVFLWLVLVENDGTAAAALPCLVAGKSCSAAAVLGCDNAAFVAAEDGGRPGWAERNLRSRESWRRRRMVVAWIRSESAGEAANECNEVAPRLLCCCKLLFYWNRSQFDSIF